LNLGTHNISAPINHPHYSFVNARAEPAALGEKIDKANGGAGAISHSLVPLILNLGRETGFAAS
jgi:hypothetical protein